MLFFSGVPFKINTYIFFGFAWYWISNEINLPFLIIESLLGVFSLDTKRRNILYGLLNNFFHYQHYQISCPTFQFVYYLNPTNNNNSAERSKISCCPGLFVWQTYTQTDLTFSSLHHNCFDIWPSDSHSHWLTQPANFLFGVVSKTNVFIFQYFIDIDIL